VAGIAVTMKLAAQPEFKTYAHQVVRNARALADALIERGCKLITGGTENHLIVIDVVQSFDIDGRVAETALDLAGLTVNKQVIPDDPRPPLKPSGIRLGTPAMTTRGLKEPEMTKVAEWIVQALRSHDQPDQLRGMHEEVRALCKTFPVPGLM
jgi:glycine hydroxymethyltransferase